MKIEFNIDYKAVFGEELTLNIFDTGKGDKPRQYRMSTMNGTCWSGNIQFSSVDFPFLKYYYSVVSNGRVDRQEWLIVPHLLELNAKKGENYTVYDRWNDIPEDSYLYTSAFTDCVNRCHLSALPEQSYAKTVRVKVHAPQLRAYERLVVVGAGSYFGNWNIVKSIPMIEEEYNNWSVDLNAEILGTGDIEFKFVAVDDRGGISPMWETGMNRTLVLPELRSGDVIVYEEDQAFFAIYNRKLAGTLVPVFSLRSRTSFGVGDFGDLKKIITFLAQTHQRVLQILPVNDTTTTHTWTDSYPYSCISIFALHPQYVDFTSLPSLKDSRKKDAFEKLRKELNALPQIDYERVNQVKMDYLKELFKQEGEKMMQSSDYQIFFKAAESWLVPYAQYSYLRDLYGTADFSLWPDHQVWNERERKDLTDVDSSIYREVVFYYFVQYILCIQMKSVHVYARSQGVILKGDIPIGVNRYGCDVWMEPKYFNLNGQAGAPPDDFSVNGQNWGFPTYNWDAMLQDDCIWWVRRFQYMANFFDAYRIDHVLGFFRIWEIPVHAVHGLLGQFTPALGMTREEIEGYGLHFQEELFLNPFIADWVLDRVFKEHTEEVKQKYLIHTHDDRYAMKPEYDTQRKVEKAFEGKTSDTDIWIRDGLYSLISDVLFVRDHKDPDKFHPRISVQFDFIYESLWDKDKAAFNRLYNDYFYRRNNQFWYGEAMKKLPKLVQATRMLVCAEDLGMVPACVPWVMNELRILSLEIQSMPKDPSTRFGHLSKNPYRSVCTISSHDMPTLRQWWDEDRNRTQDYYSSMLYREGPAPHPLPGWLAKDIVSRHLTCPSMLCVISIQDWMAINERLRLADETAERINIPADPHHYWRYRMHVNIEDLTADKEFSHTISELILEAGRK